MVSRSMDAILGDPWRLLELALDGPLHPGGTDATAALLDRAGVDGTTRLLDVGCGAGHALDLARDRGARAVGLDRRPRKAATVRGDLSSLPFGDGSFDVVLGECVLCLSPDLGRTLAEVARVLVPGGRLALSDVTVTGTPPDVPPPVDGMLCLNGPRERDEIRSRIAAAGFDVGSVRTHREDLLSMRDRLLESLDFDRLVNALGDGGERLREGKAELERAVETGRVGYVSVVATRPRGGCDG